MITDAFEYKGLDHSVNYILSMYAENAFLLLETHSESEEKRILLSAKNGINCSYT